MVLKLSDKLRHQAIFMIIVELEKKKIEKKNISRKKIIFAIFLSDTVFLPYNRLQCYLYKGRLVMINNLFSII